jgi:hypothetical protein
METGWIGGVVRTEDGTRYLVAHEYSGGMLGGLNLATGDPIRLSARHVEVIKEEVDIEGLTKAWSKEAREAALAARRGGKQPGAAKKPEAVSKTGLTASKRAEVRNKLEAEMHPDKILFKEGGQAEGQWNYFYRMGKGPEMYAERVQQVFSKGKIVDKGDHWAAWPKRSYFWVRFTPGD